MQIAEAILSIIIEKIARIENNSDIYVSSESLRRPSGIYWWSATKYKPRALAKEKQMECVQGTSESASRPCLDSQTRILVTYWLWGYLKEKVVFLDNHQTWRDLMHSLFIILAYRAAPMRASTIPNKSMVWLHVARSFIFLGGLFS